MKKYLKLLAKGRSSSGFTLIELLVASALTVVVVGAAGYGLLTILNRNKVANAASQAQQMLNLGVEFVTDEIQTASKIDLAYNSANAAGFENVRNKTDIPVLSLKIPGVNERVIYFTRDNSNEKTTTWAGPTVLYRFGPYIDTKGNYLNPTNSSQWNNGDPLIDLVGSRQNLTDANASTACSDPSWTRMPANDTDLRGFFVCVRSKGDVVEIKALTAMSMTGVKTSGNKPITYQLVTQTSVRSSDNALLAGGGAILDLATMTPNMQVTISGKIIDRISNCSAPKDKDVIFYIGDRLPITTPQTVGSNTEIQIQAVGGIEGNSSCPAYFANESGSLKAKNGDTVSDLFNNFFKIVASNFSDKQLNNAIKDIENRLTTKGLLDTKTGKIQLRDNENLFFMGDENANPRTFNYVIVQTTVTKE